MSSLDISTDEQEVAVHWFKFGPGVYLMLSLQRKWLDFEPHWKFWSRILMKTKYIWFKALKKHTKSQTKLFW